jgi:hypothetical protein
VTTLMSSAMVNAPPLLSRKCAATPPRPQRAAWHRRRHRALCHDDCGHTVGKKSKEGEKRGERRDPHPVGAHSLRHTAQQAGATSHNTTPHAAREWAGRVRGASTHAHTRTCRHSSEQRDSTASPAAPRSATRRMSMPCCVCRRPLMKVTAPAPPAAPPIAV